MGIYPLAQNIETFQCYQHCFAFEFITVETGVHVNINHANRLS